MIPSAERIRGVRYMLLVITRTIGFVLLISGVIALIYVPLILPFFDPPRFALFAIAATLPALALLVYSDRIVTWLAPTPAAECPSCGYSMRGAGSDACPECGYEWRTPSQRPGADQAESRQ